MDEGKICNWLSINLPENCPNVCISFNREIAETQIRDFGAKPLYGFEDKKEGWLPVEVFITYGGLLAPDQRCLKESDLSETGGREAKKKELDRLKKMLTNNRAHVPEKELETRFKVPYEKLLQNIRNLEEEIG